MADEPSLADALIASNEANPGDGDSPSDIEIPSDEIKESTPETPVDDSPPVGEPTEEPVEETAPDDDGSEPVDETPTDEDSDPSGLFAQAEKAGLGWLKDKYESEDAALHGMFHAVRKIGERDEDANYGRQVKEYEPQFREFLQSLNAPPAEPEPTDSGPPQFDERLLQFVSRHEASGLLVPSEDAPAGLMTPERLDAAQKYVDYHQRKRKQVEEFDPEEIRRQAVEEATQAVQLQMSEQQQKQEAQQILMKTISEPWFFARDGQGNIVRDPHSGMEVMSEKGHAYQKAANEAFYNLGITDPANCDKYARAMAMSGYNPPPPTPSPAPLAATRRAVPPGGTHKRNTGGAPPASAETDQPSNLFDALMNSNRHAEKNGVKTYEEYLG